MELGRCTPHRGLARFGEDFTTLQQAYEYV